MTDILSYVTGVLIFLIGIGVSIGLHEIGHMWPAKKFGGRVTRYMIGFGPTLWSKKTKDTEYGIKLLPLGGYVAISGMFPPRADGGLDGSGAPKRDGWLRSWVEQARQQQADADGSYDEAKAFYRLSVPKRIVIMLGGPFMNLLLGSLLILVALSGIGGYQPDTKIVHVFPCITKDVTATTCAASDPVSPAAAAGLQKGDVITGFNGQPVLLWGPVQTQLTEHPSQPIQVTALRDGKTIHFTLKPVVGLRPVFDKVTGNAATDSKGKLILKPRGLLGLQLDYRRAPFSLDHSAAFMGYTLSTTASMILDLPNQVWKLAESTFTGGERSVNGPVSVLGIGKISGSIGENANLDIPGKISTWLMMLGSLNYALFVFNLLPLLPLDGGHVLSACLDAIRKGWARIRGKQKPAPLDTAKFVPFTMVMWGLLMAMSLLVILADVINPLSLG